MPVIEARISRAEKKKLKLELAMSTGEADKPNFVECSAPNIWPLLSNVAARRSQSPLCSRMVGPHNTRYQGRPLLYEVAHRKQPKPLVLAP